MTTQAAYNVRMDNAEVNSGLFKPTAQTNIPVHYVGTRPPCRPIDNYYGAKDNDTIADDLL